MVIGYVRVSTVEQNEGRQLETMKKYNCDRVYTDKCSGKNMDRPQFLEMMDFVREGDTIIVHDFSRLSRSVKDLLDIIDKLDSKKVNLISTKENLDLNTPTGRLMLTMIASINEFERANLLERQKEGIALAKKEGKYTGRQKKKIDDSTFDNLLSQYISRQISKTQFAKSLGVSRPTLDRLLKEKAS